jgi:CheY-like chemotaxis protein
MVSMGEPRPEKSSTAVRRSRRDGTPRLKALIADDDPTIRRLLRAALKKLDCDCVTARNGREAWAAYLSEAPSLVLADWMMPELDGLELCRMIRAHKRERYTYVMLVTVLSGKGSYLEGMKAGADDFVPKPLDLDEMRARFRVAQRIIGLQHEIHRLHGLIPVCSYCRRIRDELGQWSTLEDYVAGQPGVKLSHAFCPDCYQNQVKPQLDQLDAPS